MDLNAAARLSKEDKQKLSDRDVKMMGLDPNHADFAERNAEKIAQAKEKVTALIGKYQENIVAVYGSNEEAERYAKMKLDQRAMSPRADMGQEPNLAGKIIYARNCLAFIKELNSMMKDLESGSLQSSENGHRGMLPYLRDIEGHLIDSKPI
jgi:hypothetical protein